MRPVCGVAGGFGRCAGRVRYSCLKEAAGEGAFMQIQSCRSDEKDLENGANRSAAPDWLDCSLRAEVGSQELGGGQQGRTTPAGDGKHRVSEIVIGVSCGGSGEKGWRTELDLGRRESLDDHHLSATFGTAPGDGLLARDASS